MRGVCLIHAGCEPLLIVERNFGSVKNLFFMRSREKSICLVGNLGDLFKINVGYIILFPIVFPPALRSYFGAVFFVSYEKFLFVLFLFLS